MRDRVLVCCENRRKSRPYLEALLWMGLDSNKIELLTSEEPRDDLAPVAARAAGVVLCGGRDLDPQRYGEVRRDDANLSVIPELDRMDWDLLTGAEEGQTPVWAICRGMQTLNVFQGGTLWQDLPSQLEDTLEHDPDGPHDAIAHPVHLRVYQERFAEILGRDHTQVNSRHHQAVRHLGSKLVAVAESPDGVVEVLALERDDWWVKGVQWHPENLMHISTQRLLWAEFMRVASDKATAAGAAPLLDK